MVEGWFPSLEICIVKKHHNNRCWRLVCAQMWCKLTKYMPDFWPPMCTQVTTSRVINLTKTRMVMIQSVLCCMHLHAWQTGKCSRNTFLPWYDTFFVTSTSFTLPGFLEPFQFANCGPYQQRYMLQRRNTTKPQLESNTHTWHKHYSNSEAQVYARTLLHTVQLIADPFTNSNLASTYCKYQHQPIPTLFSLRLIMTLRLQYMLKLSRTSKNWLSLCTSWCMLNLPSVRSPTLETH